MRARLEDCFRSYYVSIFGRYIIATILCSTGCESQGKVREGEVSIKREERGMVC